MKRVNNIYNNICKLENIMKMYNIVRKNTKNKRKIEKFDDFYTININYIKKILDNKCYIPGKYNIFLIKKPKIRLIMSQNIIDKIINHLCCKCILIPYIDKCLIDTNIATRIDKGTSYGINKLKKYLKKIDNSYYYLKFDISKYFYNIDHKILKEKLLKKIKDKDSIDILFRIIDSTNENYINEEIKNIKIRFNENNIPLYLSDKGLPIGNMTSQFLAIFYLNELDHFIKEKLKIKYYIRYMDDGILIHKDKQYLKFCLKEIEKIINNHNLELNDKTIIDKIDNGITFLGFKYYKINGKIIIKSLTKTKKRFIKKLKRNKDVVSYKGHFKYCTSNIYRFYISKYKH